jgi:FtsZ-binding cell division protein ZapB
VSDWQDSFAKLEEKIQKAAELFKQTQVENSRLRDEVEKLRADLRERSRHSDGSSRELSALKREREEIRARLERLLQKIDALTKPDSAG